MSKSKRAVYYIEVVGRALDVLEVFVHEQKSQLTLKEIATRLKQNTNTVFRLLYTLVEHGYVVKTSSKKYELGSKLLDLSNAKLRHTDLIAIAGWHMENLREQFRETVNLGILAEGQIRYIDVRESLERFRLAEMVGGTDPLHCTALGKAHLAWMPFEEVRRLMRESGMPRMTPHTIVTISELKTELEKTRGRGYAVDREEGMLGGYCVAVPILNEDQKPIAAMSIAGPQVRFNERQLESVASALLQAAAAIQAKLGTPSGNGAMAPPVAPRVPRAVVARPSRASRL
jgi:IclR family acetate operon transcriptional repressor